MTEEEKAVLEAEQAEDSKVEPEAKDDQTPAEGKTEVDEVSKQYEADLQKERDARLKAEKASADLAFKLRKKGREAEAEETDDDDRPITAKEFNEAINRERETITKKVTFAEAENIVSSLSDNVLERKLMLEIYQNRSFPDSLTLREKMEECQLLANKNKIIGERNEALRALKAKDSVESHYASGTQDELRGNAPKLAASTANEMARVGFKFNNTTHRFERKLDNGKILVREKDGSTHLA
jgi:hypothetical protein